MENPEKNILKHTIPADIEERYITDHVVSALVVANTRNKEIILTRESSERPTITISIKPGDSPDKVLEEYSEKVKKLILEGHGKNVKGISSQIKGINQQDI